MIKMIALFFIIIVPSAKLIEPGQQVWILDIKKKEDVYGYYGEWLQWSPCQSIFGLTEKFRTRRRPCICDNCTVYCGTLLKEEEICLDEAPVEQIEWKRT